MNITHTLLQLQEHARRSTARELAHGAIVRVLLAHTVAGNPTWRIDLANLAVAARHELGASDLDVSPAFDEADIRDEAKAALAEIADQMRTDIESAVRAGIVSEGVH